MICQLTSPERGEVFLNRDEFVRWHEDMYIAYLPHRFVHRDHQLEVLKREGFIRNFEEKEMRPGINFFEIELKYYNGKPVISEIKRVSKPGRRVYSSIKNLQKTYNGLGISILSTPRGVMSDNEAREANVGGEVLCTIY